MSTHMGGVKNDTIKGYRIADTCLLSYARSMAVQRFHLFKISRRNRCRCNLYNIWEHTFSRAIRSHRRRVTLFSHPKCDETFDELLEKLDWIRIQHEDIVA